MIDVFPFHNLPVAVFGLGRSGMAAARALIASEAEVWAWDDDKGARKRATDEGLPLRWPGSCPRTRLRSWIV